MNELLKQLHDQSMTVLRDLELEAIPKASIAHQLPALLQAELHLTEAVKLLASLLPEEGAS